MSKLIKRLQNSRSVIFDRGNFDDWCVFIVESNGFKKAPLDETYFGDLFEISKKYQQHKVYADFVLIYKRTTKMIDLSVLQLIDAIVETYRHEDKILVEQWLTVIYAGMVAEENKHLAVLKKRVKRLGMHQVLLLGISAKTAAKFSNGKKWRELDAVMKDLGF